VNDAGTLVKSPSLRKHGPLARLAQNEAASGEPPLDDYMLRVMRDENADPYRRDAIAKAAAPYCHPHLTPRPLAN
jgi:hypothetical protein